MKAYFLLLLMFLSFSILAQDTLFFRNGDKTAVKVTEIDQTLIKYKKFSNIDGPVYTTGKQELLKIRFENGTVEMISAPQEESVAAENDMKLLYTICMKGKKVFLVSDVPNANIHATNYITGWGYWIVTDKRENADFILKFVLIKSWPDYFGVAQFIDPRTNAIFYQTKKVSTEWNMDFNSKRGVIDKILRKRVRPLFES